MVDGRHECEQDRDDNHFYGISISEAEGATMRPDTTQLIFGPPGTGKTTELLNTVQLLMEDGYRSDQIMFIAFTRKAAHEAKSRASERFKLHPENLPWFSTLHALAFKQLCLNSKEVMGIGDYLKLAGILGLSLTIKGIGEDGSIAGLSKGDRLFFMENMSRALRRTLKEHWESQPDEDVYWYELERLHNTLVQYKRDTGKRDFTDIIIEFIRMDCVPPVRALIVDEAQDLTPLQWEMVEKIERTVEETYIAGDDDQAIFRWAGADVDRLIALPGERRVLPQSHRVPRKVQEVAETIVKRIDKRVPKEWMPRDTDGAVEYVSALDQVDMSQGTWLLLGRNVYLLDQYCQHCLREGFIFESQTGSPIRGKSFACIRHWEELRKGMKVKATYIKEIYDLMSTRVGVAYGFKTRVAALPDDTALTLKELNETYGLTTDKVWHEALDKLQPLEVEYFLTALKRGEKLLKTPRIKISTIHGVKGGEAENVLICTDMAERTYREFQDNPDDEWRVWYVAVTRAKERLIIMQPMTNRCVQI